MLGAVLVLVLVFGLSTFAIGFTLARETRGVSEQAASPQGPAPQSPG